MNRRKVGGGEKSAGIMNWAPIEPKAARSAGFRSAKPNNLMVLGRR